MAGFFMGILSRRSILINGSLLRLLLLLGELMRPPGNRLGVHGPMYALAFYRVVFPLMVLSLLVILPSILGMRQGVRVHAVPRLLQLILVIVLFVALLSVGQFVVFWWSHRLPVLPAFLRFGAFLPVAYTLITATMTLWRSRKISF